jgi:uncharacterized protein (TIGR00299 family) protein
VSRHAWIDASAGVAGDMLLGALVDAGADLGAVQQAVDAVIAESVRIVARPVSRAGQQATKIDVEVLATDLPHRPWSTIRDRLAAAELAEPVRQRAVSAFTGLAEAEASVHGVAVDEVHFHEVGALDSIADIVGVCAALHSLTIDSLSASAVAVGSGRIRTAHGELGVPVPAVVKLSTGWRIQSGGTGELTTPTGMALLTALCERCEDLPDLTLVASGAGAGTRDIPGRPNVTRVLVGMRPAATGNDGGEPAVIIEANVDDLDPRLWPGVLSALLTAGAADAWLTPMIMKKGRPAYTLGVLGRPEQSAQLREMIFGQTSSIGVRVRSAVKFPLPRGWVEVSVPGGRVAIKIALRQGLISQLEVEFDDVAQVATRAGVAERVVLRQAQSAADRAGLVVGAPAPADLQPDRPRRDRSRARPSPS